VLNIVKLQHFSREVDSKTEFIFGAENSKIWKVRLST